MDIDPTTLPPSVRARLETHKRETELKARCAEFAALAKSDPVEAGEMLLAATAYDAPAYMRELEADELVEFARNAKASVRRWIIEQHANPKWLMTQLTPDEDVPVWVRLRHRDYIETTDAAHVRAGRKFFVRTGACEITGEDAQRLIDAGARRLVQPPKAVTMGYIDGQRTAPEPWRYRGAVIEDIELWRAEALEAVRTVDRELDAAIKDAILIVEELPMAERRARLLGMS